MARTVFANSKNFSHKGSGDKSLCSAPDICKTPVGSSTPPIPYPIVSQASDAEGYTSSVLIDGNPTAIASSTHKSCTGDEPGSAKGLISSTTGDTTKFVSYSFDVRCEGEGVVRHQDLTTMNSGNTLGSILGAINTPATIGDESTTNESKGSFIDFYITDYEEENRISETTPGEKIWLNIRTNNLIGELVTINLDDQSVDYKYEGETLINDTLSNYEITENHEKVLLEAVKQERGVLSMYFTDIDERLISDVVPGDVVILNIKTKDMKGELVTVSLEDRTVDFKYKGETLADDKLSNYKISKDLEKILLEVVT